MAWTDCGFKFLFENCYVIVKCIYIARDTSKQTKGHKGKSMQMYSLQKTEGSINAL